MSGIAPSQIGFVKQVGVYYVNPSQGLEDNVGSDDQLPVETIDQAYALAAAASLTSFQVVLSAGVSHAMPTSNPDANISFVTQNGALPFGVAPAINAGTWNAPSSRKYSFCGVTFKGSTTFAGDSIEHRLCACESGSALTFRAAKVKSYENDFSRSTSCTITSPSAASPAVVVDADGTDWGNNLSISGTNETSYASLQVLDDVIVAPSIGAYGKLYQYGGTWLAKTNSSASIGMAANGYVYAQGVRAVRPDGSDGTINFQGGTKEFVAVDYAASGNTDNATDASPSVEINVKGMLPPKRSVAQLYVDHVQGRLVADGGIGTKSVPLISGNEALALAGSPSYLEFSPSATSYSEALSIPASKTNLQIGVGNPSTRSGQFSASAQWSVAYASTGTPRHSYRGITWNTDTTNPWSVTNGIATPVLEIENCSYIGTFTGDIAPQPTNFTGTLNLRNVDATSAPLASLRIYAGATYNLHNQTAGVAFSFPSGTGAGTTINIHASCSPGTAGVPLTYTGTLNSYNAAPTSVVGVISRQSDFTALLASTNTATWPNGLYIVSGFAPTQNAALKGAVIGHAVIGGFAFNWLERQPSFSPASVVDASGVDWTEYPNGIYLPINLVITSFLTSAPTVATTAGYYIQTAGTVVGYAVNDVIYTDGSGASYRVCTYASAPSSITVGSGSTAATYIKSGGGWSVAGNVSAASGFVPSSAFTDGQSTTSTASYVDVSGSSFSLPVGVHDVTVAVGAYTSASNLQSLFVLTDSSNNEIDGSFFVGGASLATYGKTFQVSVSVAGTYKLRFKTTGGTATISRSSCYIRWVQRAGQLPVAGPLKTTIPLVVTAVTTAPVPGTNTSSLTFFDDGSGWVDLILNLNMTSSGSAGSGDYLVDISASPYRIDTTEHKTSSSNTNPSNSDVLTPAQGYCSTGTGGASRMIVGIAPLNSSQFKIGTTDNSSVTFNRSSNFHFGNSVCVVSLRFRFKKA